MKKLFNCGLTFVMAVCLSLLFGSFGGAINVSAEENQTSLVIEDDLHDQYGAVLYEEGLLSSEHDVATFAYDQESDSVVISGKKEELIGNKILVDKDYDFSDVVIGRFSIDMTAPKKTSVTVGFYLDDEAEPFFTTNLVMQKSDGSWEYSKDVSKDVYDLKITGTHKVSFALLDNEKTPDQVSFSLKSFEFVKSSVPVVYFDIDEEYGTIQAMNSDEDHNTECYGDMNIRIPEGYESEYGDVDPGYYTYTLDSIRGRGNSTWKKSKKPYKIKLSKKADLLGMGKQKNWVLLANYYDNSLLRNKITYWLGEQINQNISEAYAYTPASVPVDVVMNGEYYGSYFLCEQIRVGENRVELNEMDPDATGAKDITGGYFVSVSPSEHEGNSDEDIAFMTSNGQEFKLEYPEYEEGEVNQAQVDYIEKYIQDVEDAIYGKDFKNSDGVYYGDLMDLTSTAYYYLLQEFCMNGDGFVTDSTYLYKTNDVYDNEGNLTEKGKLYWGPLWDFDYVAWDSTHYAEPVTEGWNHSSSMWFSKLFEDPVFASAVCEEAWPVLKERLEELIRDGGQLDQYYEEIKDSADYNFEHLGASPIARTEEMEDGEYVFEEVTLTYDEEITRLKSWIRNRINWVDANIGELEPSVCEVTFDLGDQTITQSGLQEHKVSDFPEAPEKKGYTFLHWNISYHLTYEEYLDFMGITEQDLIDSEGQEYVEELKTKGYDADEEFEQTATLPNVSAVTIRPYYVKTSTLKLPEKLYTTYPVYRIPLEGEALNIEVGCSPFDAIMGGLKWTSSDPSVATVKDGTVTPVSVGTTTITVSLGDLKTTCKVIIYTTGDEENLILWPDSAKLNASSVTMDLGSYKHFYLKYEPADAFDTKEQKIISSDESVVKIGEAGVAEAVGTGTCLIITTYNDEFISCKVTVVDPAVVSIGNTFSSKGVKYKVTSLKPRTVEVTGAKTRTITKLKVPATVKYKGKTFKVTSVGSKAFCKYTKLKYVTLGSNVQTISGKAFYGCKKLYSVKTGKNLIFIGSRAFASCPALRKVYMKSASMKLYASSFKGIKSAARVYVPKRVSGYYKTYIKKAHVIGKY